MKMLICAPFLVALGMTTVRADAAVITNCSATTALVFGNSVLTDRYSAEEASKRLKNALKGRLSQAEWEHIVTDLAYNSSGGKLNDFYEASVQAMNTDQTLSWTEFWKQLAGISVMPPPIQEAALNLLVDAAQDPMTNPELAEHVARYRQHILEGKRVILVSHSQGNFFANQAYDQLTEQERQSFGIVGVAVPSSYLYGNSYVTLVNDELISSLRSIKLSLQLAPPLDANVSNSEPPGDELGHGFESNYLAGSFSRDRILARIEQYLYSLVLPDPEAGQGVITATMTWHPTDYRSDVDLHIFEPSGSHVYYQDLIGLSGFLGRDDVSRDYLRGTEHYVVGCDDLQTGEFRFGVNYYQGYDPQTAEVAIQAGPTFQLYFVDLPVALGPQGDANPVPAAIVKVTQDGELNFVFEVIGIQ